MRLSSGLVLAFASVLQAAEHPPAPELAPEQERASQQCVVEHKEHTAAILIAHEAFTGMTADILAQAIEGGHGPQDDAGDNDSQVDSGARGASGAVDAVRVARTTTVSLLSDDLPFLLWSRYLWLAAEHFKAVVRRSSLAPGLARAMTHPVSMTLGKTAITQLLYETTSDSAYLALQAALRGADLRGVLDELRRKLWTLRRDGLIFWSAAHVVVFAMPVWWLQPIADNFLTLLFNVYQSLLAHKTVL